MFHMYHVIGVHARIAIPKLCIKRMYSSSLKSVIPDGGSLDLSTMTAK